MKVMIHSLENTVTRSTSFCWPPLIVLAVLALFASGMAVKESPDLITAFQNSLPGFLMAFGVLASCLIHKGVTFDRINKSAKFWWGLPLFKIEFPSKTVNLSRLTLITFSKEVHCGQGYGHVTHYCLFFHQMGERRALLTFHDPLEIVLFGEQLAILFDVPLGDMTEKKTKIRSPKEIRFAIKMRE